MGDVTVFERPTFAVKLSPETSPETTFEMTFDAWKDVGADFLLAGRMLNWRIGDWLIAGSERFGPQALQHANAIFRRDIDRLSPIVETCRAFPLPKRHAELTFTHHQIAAKAPDPDAALQNAERHGMTCAALKAHVRVLAPSLPLEDDDPEDTAYRRIVQAWNVASRASRQSFLESAQESHMGVIEL